MAAVDHAPAQAARNSSPVNTGTRSLFACHATSWTNSPTRSAGNGSKSRSATNFAPTNRRDPSRWSLTPFTINQRRTAPLGRRPINAAPSRPRVQRKENFTTALPWPQKGQDATTSKLPAWKSYTSHQDAKTDQRRATPGTNTRQQPGAQQGSAPGRRTQQHHCRRKADNRRAKHQKLKQVGE